MEAALLSALIAICSAVLGLWSIRRGSGLGSAGLGEVLSGTVELLLALVLLIVAVMRVFAP
jgi:hypothetical protein